MNRKAAAWSEAAGCVFIYAGAVVLHYIYPLSAGSPLSILFGAINESVWEHTKIFSAAYLAWSALQLCWLKVRFHRYVAAKCIGLYLLMGFIIGSYYFYTALTGTHILWVDILSSLAGVILTQFVTYRLETGDNTLGDYFTPALMMLMLYYLMFFSFTAFPPKADLFRDPITGAYGLRDRFLGRK